MTQAHYVSPSVNIATSTCSHTTGVTNVDTENPPMVVTNAPVVLDAALTITVLCMGDAATQTTNIAVVALVSTVGTLRSRR